MLTFEPSNAASFYTCGACGISAQVLVQAVDGDGAPVVDENWQPVLVNDEPAASGELIEHVAEAHPEG